jgi:hypothetical protein
MRCEVTRFEPEAELTRTFTIATDESQIALIRSASTRLLVIAPALTIRVAEAIAARMADLPGLSLTIILDADAEVYRMGYGDPEALEIIRKASKDAQFGLREQPGVRIGVVISDDRTMIYAPVSRNIEAGSTTEDKPNAIMLEAVATENLYEAAGDEGESKAEIGLIGMAPERVTRMQDDLKANPAQPFDLTRKLKVFMTEVQFIELRVPNASFSARKIKLPPSFQKLENLDLRRDIQSSLKVPIDLGTEVEIKITSWRRGETLVVNDAYIRRERDSIERDFFHEWKGRGKVILRKDKEQLKNELDRLVSIIGAYHGALKDKFDESRVAFRKQLVDEFLEVWRKSPPGHLARRGVPSENDCRRDIERAADEMFKKAVTLGTTEAKPVYKDISIEDLKDEELMASLRGVMEKAGVDGETVGKLFRQGDAAAAQGSFQGT